MRLAKSPFADKLVLKGGLLISSMTGIYQRITMDMDATVMGMDMDGALKLMQIRLVRTEIDDPAARLVLGNTGYVSRQTRLVSP